MKKIIDIWCVEFWGDDKKWHPETNWHTSLKYCENYVANCNDNIKRYILPSVLIFDEE